MNKRVQETLAKIMDQFQRGDVPEVVMNSMFPFPDLPSAKWSLLNRTLIVISGTIDARGYRQWQQANRFVKKGSKAIHIIVPFVKKADDLGEEKQILFGFGAKAVFRVEDTDGEPVEYGNLELPRFPLIQRAEAWGINVKAVPGNYQYFGSYSPTRKEIEMASKDECVFFHELAHAGQEIINGGLVKGQDPMQEISAELASHVLCRLVGKSGERFLGNTWRYVGHYAEKAKLSPLSACSQVLNEVEQIVSLIINGHKDKDENLSQIAA